MFYLVAGKLVASGAEAAAAAKHAQPVLLQLRALLLRITTEEINIQEKKVIQSTILNEKSYDELGQ